MSERQYGVSLSEIRSDHVNRYKWARDRVINRTAVDIACGCGYGSALMSEGAAVVTGIDRNTQAIDYARQYWSRNNTYYLIQDALNPLPAKYDYAVAFETIEHLDDDLQFLINLREFCDRLLISAPNQDSIPFDHKRFPFHVRHYTEEQMIALLESSGWGVTSIWSQMGGYSDLEPFSQEGARTLVYEAL